MRERLSLAVTVELPGSRPSHSSVRESSKHCEHGEHGEPTDSELSQHASLISWQSRSMAVWQLKATRPSSQSSRKSATTSRTPHNTMYSHFPSKIHRLSTEGSRQELHERQSTVNHVKSLNDFRGFHDPETASSSGLSHVPKHPLTLPSSLGNLCRDSSPQPDTRNLCSMPGKRFL